MQRLYPRAKDSNVCPAPKTPGDDHLLTDMEHVAGTYDTYKCPDCNIKLSGYKRGDPGLREHILEGKGQCQYLKQKFKGREDELTVLQGQIRFERGYLAFPHYILGSECGYVNLSHGKYCLVCASREGEEHSLYQACQDMTNRVLINIKHMRFNVIMNQTRQFYRGPGHTNNLETDSSQVLPCQYLHTLGDFANMYYVDGTVDTHKCYTCGLTLCHFKEGDTLLGEHVFHTYNYGNTCQALEVRFKADRYDLERILGAERARRGYIAYPTHLLEARSGFISVKGVPQCVMCGVTTIQGLYLPNHGPHCAAMKQGIGDRLQNMRLLI